MRQFIIISLILFFSLTLIQSESFSRSTAKQMVKIDKEVKRINRLTFEKLKISTQLNEPVSFPPAFGLSIEIYRNKRDNKIRKVVYEEWYPFAEGAGYAVIEYFNIKGELILLLFNHFDELEVLGEKDFGRVYFARKEVIKKDSKKVSIDFEHPKKPKRVIKGFLPKKYDKTTLALYNRLSKELNDEISSIRNYIKKGPTKYTTKEMLNESKKIVLPVYQKALSKIKKNQFSGSYTFRMPKKENNTIINDNNVILRSKPTTKSKKLNYLNVGGYIYILSVGKEESIGKWGKHHWYKIRYSHLETDKEIIGWVFGAFLEPVEEKIK
ncbi:MAG TPA: SH3 domain-containing protein [Spirochaetes bacterium]|nr:SH3 domain-containing protein [Spirochaetota bacterium]